MHVHERNINGKINDNYKELKIELTEFRDNVYIPMRNKIESIDFSSGRSTFDSAVKIINEYRNKLHSFAEKHKIKSQSKFESTFLEEISFYLFHKINVIKNKQLSIFNKGIYAGLKIKEDFSIDVIKKDVDFCIGKKIQLKIDNGKPINLIIPVISVEVKTYLDATMFGEIKSSSKTLKSSTPNSKAYVVMGYRNLSNEHILAARQDSTLDEMFALQKDKNSPIDADALFDYYSEVTDAINNLSTPPNIGKLGRLLSQK